MSAPHQREQELFEAALALPVRERAAYLDRITRGDPGLRQRVEALLEGYDCGDFLEEAAASAGGLTITAPVGLTVNPGDRVGRYKLREKIGEGGCGVVYVADQEEPVRRRVAVKVIKLGMDTESVVARFEAERQALALMDHPNIAKVLDAGSSQTGRPYFVMELVRGIKITDYCDENNLPTRERLELFIRVCQAIQHAHQKGVIHRDIKPSNVLVTVSDGEPVPKVIDFGIAKATAGPLTDKTVYTAFEQFLGTPAYMSPEQAVMNSLDIDTRSDIYSLGVLLYELLTGKTPFDSKELVAAGLDEMRRTIREKEPLRPSTRLSAMVEGELAMAAKRRRSDPASLTHLLQGDLDWVVMRALEKDRTRRYETASGLAGDLKRFLADEPVTARPPNAAYRVQKFVRRNRVLVTTSALVALALTVGAVVSAWEATRAMRAAREQSRLREEAERAQSSELQERKRAEARAYASDMNLAQQALAADNLGRARELLERHRPASIGKPGVSQDPRGWEWRYLWQQCRSDALYTLCQRSNSILSLAASPSRKWLAIAQEDQGGLAIWDLPTRREIMSFTTGGARTFPTFSPRDPLLAFANAVGPKSKEREHSILLWNMDTGQFVGKLPLAAECLGLAFSSDGKMLASATGGRLGRITLWQFPSGKERASYPAPQVLSGRDSTFAVTSDLSRAAHPMSNPSFIRLVNLETGAEVWTAKAAMEGQRIKALAFSPDGKLLASGAGFAESDIRLWDAASGKELGQLAGHSGWISALVFWPDDKTLASASADQTICVWDLANLRPLARLRGHQLEVWSLTLLSDNRTLVSGCKDGSVCVWDASSLRRRSPHLILPAPVVAWRFAPDSQSVLTVDSQGRVARWSGKDFEDQEGLLELGPGLAGAYVLAGGRSVIAGRTNGSIEFWDLMGRSLRQRSTAPAPPVDNWYRGNWHLLAHPKALILGYYGADFVREWDLATWKEREPWPRPAGFRGGGLSADGRRCLTFDWEGASVVRDLDTGQEMKPNLIIQQPMDAAFSPDGRLLAAASLIGYAKLWDSATFRELATLGGFPRGAHAVAFSPDSKRLAVGSSGAEAVKLWDMDSRQEVLTLEGTESDPGSLAFSQDGNAFGYLNSLDRTLHLWRTPSWEEIDAAERVRAY